MKGLRFELTKLEAIREEKIPVHEKLPKDCVFVKHYLQVQSNLKIEELAKKQIRDDKDMLKEIAEGFSPTKQGDASASPDLALVLR